MNSLKWEMAILGGFPKKMTFEAIPKNYTDLHKEETSPSPSLSELQQYEYFRSGIRTCLNHTVHSCGSV